MLFGDARIAAGFAAAVDVAFVLVLETVAAARRQTAAVGARAAVAVVGAATALAGRAGVAAVGAAAVDVGLAAVLGAVAAAGQGAVPAVAEAALAFAVHRAELAGGAAGATAGPTVDVDLARAEQAVVARLERLGLALVLDGAVLGKRAPTGEQQQRRRDLS